MFVKPVILISECLGFSACRYNGSIKENSFVNLLSKYVKFITVCPEVSIGLGIPRKPIQLEKYLEDIHLIQTETRIDLTAQMHRFCKLFLQNLPPLNGAILKGRSPSCGVKDTKIYSKNGIRIIKHNGYGIFAAVLKDQYPTIPIESSDRLLNSLNSRIQFLLKIFDGNIPDFLI